MTPNVVAYGFEPGEITYYRFRDPLAEIKRKTLFPVRTTDDMVFPKLPETEEQVKADLEWADILFTQRYTDPESMRALKVLLDRSGVPWVLDIDDHVLAIDRDLKAYGTYQEHEPEQMGDVREIKDISEVREGEICLKHKNGRLVALTPRVNDTRMLTYAQVMSADALIVGTKELENIYRALRTEHHPDLVFTIPYSVDEAKWTGLPKAPDHGDEIWIGWMGADGHDKDLLFILPVIQHMLEQYPQVRFFWKRSRLEQLALLSRKYPERAVRFSEWVKREEWPKSWALSGFDIMLAPLVSTPFNECRSPVKWVEAALMKVPCICSRTRGYEEGVRNRITGYLCARESQWKRALDELIRSPERRRQMGEAAYVAAKKSWTLEANIHLYREAFEEIIEKLGPFCQDRARKAA